MPPYSTIILSKNGTILAKMNEEIKKVLKKIRLEQNTIIT